MNKALITVLFPLWIILSAGCISYTTPGELIEFVYIPAGSFEMGSESAPDEGPVHTVKFENGFYMGAYEVTQKQWISVMGDNPSKFPGEDRPVENVSWANIMVFINELNKLEGEGKYRLPTEAEWEYAARAGTTSDYYFGDNPELLDQYAWWAGNSDGVTHNVGQFPPNPWGLYDITGNVWEMCSDWYIGDYYSISPEVNPQGPAKGEQYPNRIRRGGGSWNEDPGSCRSSYRSYDRPNRKSTMNGFRLIRNYQD